MIRFHPVKVVYLIEEKSDGISSRGTTFFILKIAEDRK